MVNTALNTVSSVGGQLLIEDSADEVRSTYEELVTAMRRYFVVETQLPAGPDRNSRINDLIEPVLHHSDRLLGLCRSHLTELERPLRVGESSQGALPVRST
jgi:hypothetical protein